MIFTEASISYENCVLLKRIYITCSAQNLLHVHVDTVEENAIITQNVKSLRFVKEVPFLTMHWFTIFQFFYDLQALMFRFFFKFFFQRLSDIKEINLKGVLILFMPTYFKTRESV